MVARGRSDARREIDSATACLADGVSKTYGRRDTAVQALRDVTLRIPSGQFTAIMGPSGSGKSTLLHCLAALDTPTAGRVFLGRTELTALSRRQQAQVRRDRIGFVFQAFNLVPTLNAIENIALPQLLAGRRPDQQWLDYVVAEIGLADRLHHRPSELSGGQQQRVALARALAGRPEVIFADEPTGNLDTTATGEMLRLLRDAVDQFDQTVVTVTHDPTIAGHADRVLFFSDGRVVDEVERPDVDDVLDRVRHTDTVGGRHDPARSDGQHTMRSRWRRGPDEPTPGRPMVGSDDEVEVARQERWLERIRQQFDAEHQTTSANGDSDDRGAGGAAAELGAATIPAHDHASRNAWTNGAGHPAAPIDRDQHGASDDASALHGGPDIPTATSGTWQTDDGWLPPERSWAEVTNNGDRTGEYADTAPHAPVPWSRPRSEIEVDDEVTDAPSDDGWHVESDPWAPADRSRAEEYHHDTGASRRGRGWRDGDDVWSTSPPWTRQHDEPSNDHARPEDAADGERDVRARDKLSDEPVQHDWDVSERRRTDDAGVDRSAPPDPEVHDPQPVTDHVDPWRDVWDASTAPDVAEVWTPAFDTGWTAYDTDTSLEQPTSSHAEASPPVRIPPARDTGEEPAGLQQQAVAADPDPPTDTAPPGSDAAPPTDTAPPADTDHAAAPADRPDHAVGHRNGRPNTTRDDPVLPAELASLRSTRRTDRTDDPLEALQSLQAQLERLGSGRRTARSASRPPRGRSDTDRPERR